MNLMANVTQLAARYKPWANSTFCRPCRPMSRACSVASLLVRVRMIPTQIEIETNGSVSLSRCGLPLRSQAHLLTR